jgi:Protein of unknown function (DUF3224)
MPLINKVSGTFDVKMQPQPAPESTAPDLAPNTTLARLLLDKRYHGELSASGQGQMLSAVTTTPGSAAYVAIEQVSGTLAGKAGSFVLQHTGLMNRGDKQLTITIVPDSGTGQLAGLQGQMDIRIVDGQHFYDLSYSLP